MSNVAIVGVGLHPFGRTEGVPGREQGAVAARSALRDAGISWKDVDLALGGSSAAGSPDTLLGLLGHTGIPFININNGCATGGAALAVAAAMIEGGAANIAMVVGFDKHPRGAFHRRPDEIGLGDWYGRTGLMLTTQHMAMKTQRYMADHDISPTTLGSVAARAFRNGALNPMAWRRKTMSVEEILSAPMISHPLTQYMFCSPGEGGAALVLARASEASRFPHVPVYLKGMSVQTREYGSFEVASPWISPDIPSSPTVPAAAKVFASSGVDPSDVDVAQIQDTDCGSEVIHMAETGLCKDGEQTALLATGATEIGGSLPINTDGGCLAMGEPIGASGLRQVYENVLQIRWEAGARQVPNDPKVAFSHVCGGLGISACAIVTR